MILTSATTRGALLTGDQLDEVNQTYDDNAVTVEVWSAPVDPLTDPVLLAEYKVAREK